MSYEDEYLQKQKKIRDESYVSAIEEDGENKLEVTPSEDTDQVVVNTDKTLPSQFSKLEGKHLRFKDFYQDARTFLEKANSTKFILVVYILLTSPLLLMGGYLSETVYREILILITLTYLGVDVYEKKALVRK